MAGGRQEGGMTGKRRCFVEVVKGNTSLGGAKEEVGGERENVVVFKSSADEEKWLEGAHVGLLKHQYSWETHGEELNAECGDKLKLRDLGNNLVLIQGEEKENTAAVIKGFEEWTAHWFEWWRKWSPAVTPQRRSIWTRWTGFPLNAWSFNLFKLGTSTFGKL